MILITIINIQVRKSFVPSLICAALYWIISAWIYDRHYSGVSLHKVVINLSVVFGIYEFGFFGIFYGPLLLILFQYVYE
jgi:predicted PurR-regulated permease PerM